MYDVLLQQVGAYNSERAAHAYWLMYVSIHEVDIYVSLVLRNVFFDPFLRGGVNHLLPYFLLCHDVLPTSRYAALQAGSSAAATVACRDGARQRGGQAWHVLDITETPAELEASPEVL